MDAGSNPANSTNKLFLFFLNKIMIKKLIFIKKKKIKNKRIDKFLFFFLKKKISRKKIQKNIFKKKILLNKKNINKKNKKIKLNDKIVIFIFKKKKKKIIENKNIKINIIYEDNYLLIINKQPGLVVHPGYGNYNNTLINWLKFYFKKKKKKKLNYSNYRFGLLHRLDKDTSGLLLIAKTKHSFINIKNQFLNKTIKKKYLTLIWGKPFKKKDVIKNYIGRDLNNRIKMKVYNNKKYGKFSVTKYKIIKNYKFLTLVKCIIKTGRTHQIRVHFNSIGHSIFNDKIYGGNKIKIFNKKKNKKKILKCFKILPRLALHSYYLKFNHPINNKKIIFSIKLPNDIKNLIKYIKKKLF
ncbi:MAG: RluA family pseudouridine synthase [Candidatus Shikimatogenerans bostrichidophilus]|nr:MAG: RluA family pseudouridine synthase [Candidatus Shikimatogenerans bostrichidophilus]